VPLSSKRNLEICSAEPLRDTLGDFKDDLVDVVFVLFEVVKADEDIFGEVIDGGIIW
jgi:hypothetical protein